MTRCRLVLVVGLGSAGLLAGCRRVPITNYVAIDSAGVRIVTNRAPLWGSSRPWSVAETPRTRIPKVASDSSTELLTVEGAMRRSDGTIVVGDRAASAVKYFDSAGGLQMTRGRPGRGPGEYEYLAWLMACGGDSAFVFDIVSQLVSVLRPDGGVSRAFRITTPEHASPFEVRCGRQGQMVSSGWGSDESPSRNPYRPRVPVTLEGPDGNIRTTFGTFPGTEMTPEPHGAGPRRLGRLLLLGIGDSTAWIVPNETSEIRGYRLTGPLALIVRTPALNHATTDADIEFHRQRALDSTDSEDKRERVRTQFAATPAPQTLPPFLDLMVDADNYLWVKPYPRAVDPDPLWLVFQADGVWVGEVRVPPGVRVVEIGHDYLLGVGQETNGAQFVAVYLLNRSMAP